MDAMTTPPLSPANLSQPEPQGATKGELSQLYRKHGGFNYDGMDEIEFENAVNEAIARWGRSAIEPQSENCPGCEGTPAANNSPCTVCGQLAQPEPQELTDEELLRCYGLAKRDHCYEGPIDDWPKRAERAATVAGLRAVLAADRARFDRP
jgi:hypothetical protein